MPDDEKLPTRVAQLQTKAERVEWLMASVYCTCGMHDGCAGHLYTLATCNAGPTNPYGLAKRTREDLAEMIDNGRTDKDILKELLKQRGPNLLRPHLLP
jgi:hypothetical protein